MLSVLIIAQIPIKSVLYLGNVYVVVVIVFFFFFSVVVFVGFVLSVVVFDVVVFVVALIQNFRNTVFNQRSLIFTNSTIIFF